MAKKIGPFKTKLNIVEEPRPIPIFADHIRTIGINEVIMVRFYSIAFPGDVKEPPAEVDAQLVSEVVVPLRVWEQMIDEIVKKRAPGSNQEEAEE